MKAEQQVATLRVQLGEVRATNAARVAVRCSVGNWSFLLSYVTRWSDGSSRFVQDDVKTFLTTFECADQAVILEMEAAQTLESAGWCDDGRKVVEELPAEQQR